MHSPPLPPPLTLLNNLPLLVSYALLLHFDTDAPPSVWTVPGSWCLPSLVYGSRLVNRHLDRTLFTTLRPAACVESLVHRDQVMGVPYQPRADSYFLLSGLDFNEGSGRIPASGRLPTGNSGTG